MTTSLLIDLVILTLLVVALLWGVLLARRIARLQAVLIELAPVLQAFSDAVDQGERSLVTLREETQRLEDIEKNRSVVPVAAVSEKPVARLGRSALVRSFFETARAKVNG